jgi:hypothetical protein
MKERTKSAEKFGRSKSKDEFGANYHDGSYINMDDHPEPNDHMYEVFVQKCIMVLMPRHDESGCFQQIVSRKRTCTVARGSRFDAPRSQFLDAPSSPGESCASVHHGPAHSVAHVRTVNGRGGSTSGCDVDAEDRTGPTARRRCAAPHSVDECDGVDSTSSATRCTVDTAPHEWYNGSSQAVARALWQP